MEPNFEKAPFRQSSVVGSASTQVHTSALAPKGCAACRDDANRAIEKLNGFGYDNLILRVEYAAPRAERPT